nr:MAG TPA: hypothetical protein [Caudoviricetes sp.]
MNIQLTFIWLFIQCQVVSVLREVLLCSGSGKMYNHGHKIFFVHAFVHNGIE